MVGMAFRAMIHACATHQFRGILFEINDNGRVIKGLKEIKAGLKKRVLVGVGNELMGDDAIGLLVVRRLKERFEKLGFKVEEAESPSLNLLEFIGEYDFAVIVDGVKTKDGEVGSVWVWKADELPFKTPITIHYLGIPETISLAKGLGIKLPKNLYLVGVEVEKTELSEKLSKKLSEKFEKIVDEVYEKTVKLLKD